MLNAAFLLVVAGVATVGALLNRRLHWGAVALAGAALLLITAVFDNVMIAVGLVGYDDARISGLLLGIAPIEDFAYAIGAAVLLPALWQLLGRREHRDG
jgi:lycopene cyclase domain-containing protein